MQRLCIKVAKMFALLFYHGIQSEGRFTFQVTLASSYSCLYLELNALMQLCNVGSACKTIDVVHSYRHNYLQLRAYFLRQNMAALSPSGWPPKEAKFCEL